MLVCDDPSPFLWFSTITFVCYLTIDETVMNQCLGYIINTLRVFFTLFLSVLSRVEEINKSLLKSQQIKALHESCLHGFIYTQGIGLCSAMEKYLFLPTTAEPSLQMRDS